MKKFILLFFPVLTGIGITQISAQVIAIGPDSNICPGQSLTLTATVPSFSTTPPTQILFDNGWSGPTNYCDDCNSANYIPIGFNFTYYGNTYNQCIVTTNGYIQFGTPPGGYSPWSIGGGIPSAGAPLNAIMAPWQDIYPGTGGTGIVRYKTFGIAPNRVFVVEYLDIPMFSCTNFCFGNQIKLYEGTNVIETHIAYKQICSSWNGGYAIHGIQNATGSIAHVVPGRNYPSVWSAIADGKRWTPTSTTNYTLTNVPFNPSYMPATLPPSGITWYANGTSIGTGTSVNVSPNANTTYVARLTYSSCSQVTAFADTMRVFMASLPLTTSGNTAMCIGDSVQIGVTTTATGTTNFSWTPTNTLINPATNSPIAFPPATATYTVTATNGLCSNTAQLTVTVNPLPTISFNYTDPSICPGDSVQLVANGGTNYNWYIGTDLSSYNTAATYASPLANTQYGVIVTDANNCTDTAYNNVLLYIPPIISAGTSEASICAGRTMGLTATGASSYAWSPPIGLDYDYGSNPNATLTATTTYQVIGTDVNNCKDTTSVTVIVDPLPAVSFTAQDVNGCEPLTANFENSSNVSNSNISSYFWSFEGNGTSTDVDPTVIFPVDGLYDVSLVAVSDSGCVDSLRVQDMIHVYNVPDAGFSASPQPTTVGDPEIYFTNTSSGDVTIWHWFFDSLGTSGYSDPSYTFNEAGTYTVTLIVETQYGCSDTATGTIIVDQLSEIWIPNSFTPNEDGLNDIWFPIGGNLNTKNVSIAVDVYNRWGHPVFRSTTSDKPWNGYDQNVGSRCPEGVYTYRVNFVNEQGKETNVMGHINLIR